MPLYYVNHPELHCARMSWLEVLRKFKTMALLPISATSATNVFINLIRLRIRNTFLKVWQNNLQIVLFHEQP